MANEVGNRRLYMDRKLSFNSVVSNIAQRSFRKLKPVYEFIYTLPVNVKKLLTESLVLFISGYHDVGYDSLQI